MIVPVDANIYVRTYQNLRKYKYIEIKFGEMLNVKTKMITVAICSLGMIEKWSDSYPAHIPGNTNLVKIQNVVPMDIADILHKILLM